MIRMSLTHSMVLTSGSRPRFRPAPPVGMAEQGRILGEHEMSVALRLQRLLGMGTMGCVAGYDPLRRGFGSTVRCG